MKKSESIEVQLPYVRTFYTEGTCDIFCAFPPTNLKEFDKS